MKTALLCLAIAAAAGGQGVTAAAGGETVSHFASPVSIRPVSDYHFRVYRFRYGMEISEDRLFGSSDSRAVSAEFEFDLVVDFSKIRDRDTTDAGEDGIEIAFTPETRHFRMVPESRIASEDNTIQTRLLGWLYASGVRDEDWALLEERAREFVETIRGDWGPTPLNTAAEFNLAVQPMEERYEDDGAVAAVPGDGRRRAVR